MKNKGFTLIELLAVIVILAIIALIATPMILGVVENARKSSAESSVLGYVDSIEKQIMMNEMDSTKKNIIDDTYTISNDGGITGTKSGNTDKIAVEVKGRVPTGTVIVLKHKVASASTFTVSGYSVSYNASNGTATATKSGSSSNTESGNNTPNYANYTVGQAVNYNPATNASCDSPVSTPGTKTGCMKWYVIADNGSTVDVLLDHNTTATTSYNSTTPYVEYASSSIKNVVNTDATGWTSGLNPRLIEANDIARIVGNTEWDSSTAASSQYFFFGSKNTTAYSSQTSDEQERQRSFAWLFDYTNNCTNEGCQTANSSTSGYWTSSSISDNTNFAWVVDRYARLGSYSNVNSTAYYGVRPVITIQKSALN